jgi:hypothetical protein
LAGSRGSTNAHELTGQADVDSSHVATLYAGGTAYGLSQSVPWLDASGSLHENGWPACLDVGNNPTVRFGGMFVPLPAGGAFAEVTYIDCSAR